MASKGATKHCCWGKCNSDSRYADRLPTDVFFIRFTKPGNIKEVMTNWEKQREGERTEKCKRWVHACGRRDFSKLCQVKKDTYICSLHFVGENGPTDDNPDPLIATLSEEQLKQKSSGKKKVPKSRTPILKRGPSCNIIALNPTRTQRKTLTMVIWSKLMRMIQYLRKINTLKPFTRRPFLDQKLKILC